MTTPGFRPTHVVPQDGMAAWESPDPSRPTVPLDALLPVRLLDRLGDWARIACANGWSAWVDGRLLVAVPQAPPAAGSPLARTADPRPLLARVEQALTGYRGAAEDLAAGRLDGESFRARTRGQRVGVIVDGESLWLYDADHERWVYCDGTRLSTYASTGDPAAGTPEPGGDEPEPPPERHEPQHFAEEPAPGGHDPTRVVQEAEVAPGGHGPERLVQEAAPGDHEATQLVQEADPDGQDPTRLVPRVPDEPGDR
ncbi:hypothetical protein [Streptomyces sp. NPDC005485]|uniref:hypothetical protein n=1 Tax=Streptomyces sp. NPDC005485 TaxID=3155591 RepID=UPI0033BCD1F2